jgi:hypothetical protein
MNGGYIIRAVIADGYLKVLTDLFVTNDYLRNMRKGPTEVTFQIGWQGTEGPKSDTYLAYLVDVRAIGTGNNAGMEFIAIDPPSWFLNAGKGDGRVYKGKVSDVIKQVVNDYSGGKVTPEVSDTKDNPENRWWMMRMDPKTFIKSMLDWSCTMCNKQTAWITASDGNTSQAQPRIIIKEQADLTPNNLGIINCTSTNDDTGDLIKFDFASDAIITEYQTKLVTQSISSVSGQYIDKKSDKQHAVVDDDDTGNKFNARTDAEHSYKKPDGEYSTSIMAIPELPGREMGLKYQDYVDGRARGRFMSMLPFAMRLKATVRGSPTLTKSTELGVSTLTLKWSGSFLPNFFMGGNWMYYGFHHRFRPGQYETDVYLYRFDYDAAARQIP